MLGCRVADMLRRAGIRTHVDNRPQLSPGFKFNDWELSGVHGPARARPQ